MWLINFHLGFSMLLLVAYIGIYCVFYRKIKRKARSIKAKRTSRLNWMAKSIKLLLFLFIPGINVITLISLLLVIAADKEDLELLYHYGEEEE